jgi:hypothetical protein
MNLVNFFSTCLPSLSTPVYNVVGVVNGFLMQFETNL